VYHACLGSPCVDVTKKCSRLENKRKEIRCCAVEEGATVVFPSRMCIFRTVHECDMYWWLFHVICMCARTTNSNYLNVSLFPRCRSSSFPLQNEGPRGQFAVEQIKIAEFMAKDIFGKEYPYSFQVCGWVVGRGVDICLLHELVYSCHSLICGHLYRV